MHLQHRIHLMVELGKYMQSGHESWTAAKKKAFEENGWFTPEFIDLATSHIAGCWLEETRLREWLGCYSIPSTNPDPKNIGLIMAGNIPLVGFHDFLSIFLSGHKQTAKPSSRDNSLIRHLAEDLVKRDPAVNDWIGFADMLKGCDAYIATGSNNSARYFEYYFKKYPHLIRKNRTSVAVLDGTETIDELQNLAGDIYTYFGLGCRNITKLYAPRQYDFLPLLENCRVFDYLADHHKYKNNYDYQLTLFIINKKFYMTNGSMLLSEEKSPFSPISVVHYEYYDRPEEISHELAGNPDIQCVAGKGQVPFGQAQKPRLEDYADNVDTLEFLSAL